MVRAAFSNLDVRFWRYSGRGLGAYGTTLTLCIDHSSLALGAPILEALQELDAGEVPQQRVVTFRSGQRRTSIQKLKLQLIEPTAEMRVMHMLVDNDVATIEVTSLGLDVLRDAFQTWLAGAEDFCVSSRNANIRRHLLGVLDNACGELWFWGPGYSEP